ncbi:CARDB domain-containing protein [Flaviaesturariibacter aridisoli]|nr:CARDB domain-containing protein [Flaviaesturariibacter aridisoli]
MKRSLILLLTFFVACIAQGQTVQIGTIDPAVFCAGSTLNIPYTADGVFDGANVFSAELSSANGSFGSPVTIGSVQATASGTISATLPSGAVTGNGYRIRVVASNPVVTGPDNGLNISINAPPVLQVSGPTTTCSGSTATLVASGAGTYSWSPALLPADVAPANVRMAVGLRLLKAGYTGSIIRLRRASDNAEMDFGASGPHLDLDAIHTWLGGSAGYCVKLYDQSGNGLDEVQATEGAQPQFIESSLLNSRPALVFNTSQYMQMPTYLTNPFTVICASRQTGGARARVLSSVSNNWLLGFHGGRHGDAYFEGWVHLDYSMAADNSIYVHTGASNGSVSQVYENGSLLSSNSNGVYPPYGLQLNGNGYYGERSDCEFYDIVAYNTVLSPEARSKAESSIWNYYVAANQQFISLSPGQSVQYTVTGNTPGCSSVSQTVTVANSAIGDPSVFGDNQWNVYAWNAGTYYDNGSSWNDNYAGYYTAPGLNFNSQSQWDPNASPSSAPGYQGCTVNNDYFSWAAKRKGFPCGYYKIILPYHDYYARIKINGQQVYYSCCGNTTVWTGYLNDTSTVELAITDDTYSSYGALNFELVPEIGISYPSATASTGCNTGSDLTPTVVLAPGAPAGYFTATPAGLVIDSLTGVVSPSSSAAGDYTIYYIDTLQACGQHVDTATTTLKIRNAQGDPAVFGTNAWIVYGWNSGYYYDIGNSWSTNYAGYFVDSSLNHNSQNFWPYWTSPSDAPGWQGCPINVDFHSWSAKRKGFPCGYYTISLPYHDDYAQVLVNGVLVYNTCCGNTNVWTGYLNDTSTVEFRVTEGSSYSYGSIVFTPTAKATISYPASTYCTSAGDLTPTLTQAPDGAGGYFTATPAGLSIDSSTGVIHALTSQAGDYTIAYHNVYSSACGVDSTQATFSLHLTAVAGDPAVYGNNVWNVYAWNGGTSYNDGNSWTTNYAGYFTDTALNHHSDAFWYGYYSPSSAPGWQGCAVNWDYHSWAAKRQGFPCGYYQINIPTHDDEAELWINGVRVWTHSGCCDYHGDVWRGYLSSTDSVMFRVTEGGGYSNGYIDLVRIEPAAISYPLSPYCNTGGSAPVTLTGVTDGTFFAGDSLSIDPATGTIHLNASAVGMHTVSYVLSHAGCANDTVTTTVEISPSPSAAISYAQAAYCTTMGAIEVVRNGAGGGTFVATPAGLVIDETTGTITGYSSLPGTYTVTYTVPASGDCASFTNSTQVTISNPPSATITYGTNTFCTNVDSVQVQLTGTPGGHFYNYAGFNVNPVSGTLYPSSSGPISNYIYYDAFTPGCQSSGTYVFVQINQAPTASISYGGTPYYVGGGVVNVSLSGTTGGTYSVSPSGLSLNTTTGSVNLNITAPGTYTVTYTMPSGTCPGATTSTTIQVLPTASAQISYTGNPFCSGFGVATATQTGLGGGVYSAQPSGLVLNSGNGDINVSSSTPGNYTVTYFIPSGNGHGEVTATTNITITATPSAAISYSGSPYCNNSGSATVTRTGTGGGTYTSAPGGLALNGSTGDLFPQSSLPGTYTVTYSIPATGGCAAFSTSRTVTILASGTVNTPAGQTLCNGAGTTPVLFGGGTAGTVYNWTNNDPVIGLGASGAGDIPSFTAINNSGSTRVATITVTPVSGSGCAGTARSFQLIVNPSPAVTISGGSEENYCIGSSVTLTASAGTSYQWSTGSTTQSIQVAANGTYTVTVTNANGCAGTASKTVTYGTNHLPSLSFTGATGFVSSVMNPASGLPTSDYRFEVRYTDADGDLPQSNTIKLLLDFEGNGSFNDGGDRTLYLTEKDPADQNVTDGKDYFIVVNFLQASANWHTTVQATDQGGCAASFGPFAGPVVLPRVDVSIFANDITFSNAHPDPAQPLTITATIHNNSGRDASNFQVRLVNQNDTATHYTVLSVPFLSGAGGTTQVSWNITTPNVPMWCPMQVFIDDANVLDESNELDNQAIRPFINGNYQLPGDIGITSAPTPSSIYTGDNITFSGAAWYRNTAVQLQDSSCAGATVTIKVVETGQTQVVYSNALGAYAASFSGPATPGTYHVQVTITDYTLEGDTTTQFVVIPRPLCTGPDLTSALSIGAGTITPQYPASNTRYIVVGQSLSGSVTEGNGGGVDAGSHKLSIEAPTASGVPAPFAISSMASGAQQTITLPALTFNSIGSTYIRSLADAANDVDELCNGESNNSSYTGVVVLPNAPDIAPANLLPSYFNANQCQGIPNVSFLVRNLGGLPTGSFNARLTVLRNGVVETTLTQPVGNINPLWETTVNFNYVYSGLTGVYTFTLDCDVPNAISEYNEGNNGASYQVQVAACNPDLTVWGCGNVTVMPAEPSLPANITISAQLANTSLVAISGPLTVDFNVAGTHYTHTFTGTLAPGANTLVSVTVPAPAPGNNDLTITVDPGNTLSETNEANNSTSAKLCWDFQPTNGACGSGLYIQPTQIVNTPVTLATGLFNFGLYKATHAQVRFEVSGPGISGWLNLGTVSTNIANTCACPLGLGLPNAYVFTQTGDYQVRITADPANQYTECNEGNNQIVVSVHVVLPLPDYLTRSEYIAPSLLNPEPGQPIDIDISYRNNGASTTDSSTVYTQVDNDSLTQVRVPGLVNSQLSTVRLPRQWSSDLRGIHVIRAVVDKDDEIGEGDELNNEATRAVIVGKAPNLLWQSFTLDNNSPAAGTTLHIMGRIHNIGFEDCDAVLQLLYLNDQGQEVLISQRNISVAEGADYDLQAVWRVTDAQTRVIARIINSMPSEYNTDDNEAGADIGGMSVLATSTPASCTGTTDGVARVAISGGLAPYSRLWSNGETGDSIIVGSGIYTVTVSDANGSIVTDTVQVGTNGSNCQEIVSATGANALCSGSSLSVSFTVSGTFSAGNQFIAQLSDASGSFTNPVTIGSVTATGSGVINATIPANTASGNGYQVRVVSTQPVITEATGHSLSISAPANASISYSGSPYCTGSGSIAVTQTGTTGGTYSATPAGLSLDATTGAINLATSQPGTYTITYHIAAVNSCGAFSTATTVTVNAAPAATISYSGPFCPSGTTQPSLSGNGGGVFSSTAGLVLDATTGAVNLGTSVSGTYTVYYTLAASGTCPQVQASTMLTIYPKAVANAISNLTTRNGATTAPVTFTGSPAGIVYDWVNSNPAIGLAASGSGNLPSFTAVNTGSMPVTATVTVTPVYMGGDLPCAGAPQTFTITVNPFVVSTLAYPASPYCARGNAIPELGGQGGGTFAAPAGLSISSSTGVVNLAGSTPGTYTVTYNYSSYGQAGTASAQITVAPLPSINTVANQLVCGSTTLPAIAFSGNGTSYTWTNDNPSIGLPASGTGQIPAFTAMNNGPVNAIATITATAVSGGCTSTPVSFRITVKPTPNVTIPANTIVCAGTASPALNFTGTIPGAVYSWTNNNSATGIAASGTGSIASYNPINNTGVNQVSTISVTPAANSCTGAAQSFTLTVVPAAGTISYSGSPFCPTGSASVNRSGSANGTYSASPAGLAIDPATGLLNLVASAPGTYTVTYTVGSGGGGCSNTASTQVTVNSRPTVNTIGNQVFCPGGTTAPVAFSGTGATSYTWTNSNTAIGLAASGSGNSIPAFIPVNNGTSTANATIAVTAVGACPGNTISFRISVSPMPKVNAVADQVYCRGVNAAAVSFSGPVAGTQYQWSQSNPAVGLPYTTGYGTIPGFTTQNGTSGSILSQVTVTPIANKCLGTPVPFSYIVNNCVAQSGNTGGSDANARLSTQVTVGPNPTQNQVTIWLSGKTEGTHTVELLDQYGRTLIKPASFTGSSYTLSLVGFTSGTYVLRIVNTQTKETAERKVIKL